MTGRRRWSLRRLGIAGLITGTAVSIVWNRVAFLKAQVCELVPASLLGILVTAVVSRLTKPPYDVGRMFQLMG